MKWFQNQFHLLRHRLGEVRLTFQQAIYLSLLGHVILFLFLALVANLFQIPGLTNPPLVFEFVFMPVEEGKDSGQHLQSQNETPPQNNAAKQPRPEPSEILKSQVASALTQPEQELPKTQRRQRSEAVASAAAPRKNFDRQATDARETVQNDALMEQNAEPTSQPENPETVPMRQPFYLKALLPTSFAVPKTGRADVPVLSAKIAMSRREKKMLQKRFKKWTENIEKIILKDSTLVWSDKGQTYRARFFRRAAQNSTDIDEMVVRVETQENGVALSTEMRMKRLAFSNFAQFVDYWDPWVAIHDDELEGRFHANSMINISQTGKVVPKFHGKVTTASYEINTRGSKPFFDSESVFMGGLETGVKAIHLPKRFQPLLSDSTLADEDCLKFDDDVQVCFYRSGKVGWRRLGTAEPEHKMEMPGKSFYIFGSRKKELHLRGVVRGKVLVYSPGKIVIDDDLTYAHHPEASLVADDYLGIVSDSNVEIAHPRVTGPGDLSIYASIYAKKRFVVKHRYSKNHGTLFVYGSLTAGSLSATEPRYATRIRFDRRLEERRPPNFPLTDRYEIIDWDGAWRVKQN